MTSLPGLCDTVSPSRSHEPSSLRHEPSSSPFSLPSFARPSASIASRKTPMSARQGRHPATPLPDVAVGISASHQTPRPDGRDGRAIGGSYRHRRRIPRQRHHPTADQCDGIMGGACAPLSPIDVRGSASSDPPTPRNPRGEVSLCVPLSSGRDPDSGDPELPLEEDSDSERDAASSLLLSASARECRGHPHRATEDQEEARASTSEKAERRPASASLSCPETFADACLLGSLYAVAAVSLQERDPIGPTAAPRDPTGDASVESASAAGATQGPIERDELLLVRLAQYVPAPSRRRKRQRGRSEEEGEPVQGSRSDGKESERTDPEPDNDAITPKRSGCDGRETDADTECEPRFEREPKPSRYFARKIHVPEYVEEWLRSNYMANPEGSVSKHDIYVAYVDVCRDRGDTECMPNIFAKMLKKIYPNLRSRRLGPRGCGVPHHGGISKVTGSRRADKKSKRRRGIANESEAFTDAPASVGATDGMHALRTRPGSLSRRESDRTKGACSWRSKRQARLYETNRAVIDTNHRGRWIAVFEGAVVYEARSEEALCTAIQRAGDTRDLHIANPMPLSRRIREQVLRRSKHQTRDAVGPGVDTVL